MHFGGSAKKCPDSLCSLCCMMLISSFGVCMCVCALCGVVVRVFLGVMYIYICNIIYVVYIYIHCTYDIIHNISRLLTST